MKSRVYAGTSGWAYVKWKPEFYPASVPASKFLEYYSSQLNSVEVNFTFRRKLLHSTAHKWIAAVPDGFLFSFKAHQSITHFRRLKNVDDVLTNFLASLEPFQKAKKLGVVLFQLPHNMKSDSELLADFLKELPPGIRYSVEFREPSWLDKDVYNVLEKNSVALCVTEGTEELTTPDRQTADFRYYRLRRPRYSARMIAKLAEDFNASGQNIFIYFKHEDTAAGANFAKALLQRTSEPKTRTKQVTGSRVR